jgi:hypothetical protein
MDEIIKSHFWLDLIPLWGVFLLTIAIVILSLKFGSFLGNRKRRCSGIESDPSVNTIIGATLGLLGFLLVFTFGISAERFQMRLQLLLDEINGIGTTYLRAGLLPEPHCSQIRKLLREYVDIRVNLAKVKKSEQEKILQAMQHSESLQNQIWQHAEAIAVAARNPPIDALFIDSLNKLIDLQTSRATVFRYRIPMVIWNVLYFITILSMLTVGYQLGLSGKSSFNLIIVLTLTFAMVIVLIADLDRVSEGRLQVSQQPMIELQLKLEQGQPTQ